MIRPPISGNCPSGHAERLAEAVVEALRDVAGELEVLALVVADRDEVGLVEQDVARHQHRVGEERRRDELVALRLVLELRHAAQLAVARHGRQQPRRLGVRRHVALAEDRRALGVEARGEEHRGEVEGRACAAPPGRSRRVIECRSTMQKNASPTSWVWTYWRKPPL